MFASLFDNSNVVSQFNTQTNSEHALSIKCVLSENMTQNQLK